VHAAPVEKRGVTLVAVVLAVVSAATSAHLPVSTNVPQAQAAFDRGLFLYYAYDGDDAARAFERAAALDPTLAMAYWGIALANGPDLNTPVTPERFDVAARAMRKAKSLEAAASPRERELIDAMALRFQGAFANWSAEDTAYRRAMLAFAETSDDEDAELLTAEALLEHGGLTWDRGALASDESQRASELVDEVLRNDPSSVMANHLCIHIYDLAPDRAPALACAQRLDAADFPPEAEHLAHMPAHYWIETGDYAAALRSCERAYALMSRPTDAGTVAHDQRYAKHDVAVGYSAAMMLGNYAIAQRWSDRMSAVEGSSFDALTALRFGRYQTAYAAAVGDAFAAASVRGFAALHLGRIAEARVIAARLRVPRPTQGYLPQLFLAKVAAADGDLVASERWIAQARENQREEFSGELIPLIPADEVLGDIRLEHGDASGAAAAFGDALAAYPNDPRARFGLSQALAAGGDAAKAAKVRASFERSWEGADTSAGDALP
jgi:tetratricopeptide (TPR) repeat protein